MPRSLFLLLLFCQKSSSGTRCDEGGKSKSIGSCERVKDNKYQIRGVKILPMWQFVMNKQKHQDDGKREQRVEGFAVGKYAPSVDKELETNSIRNSSDKVKPNELEAPIFYYQRDPSHLRKTSVSNSSIYTTHMSGVKRNPKKRVTDFQPRFDSSEEVEDVDIKTNHYPSLPFLPTRGEVNGPNIETVGDTLGSSINTLDNDQENSIRVDERKLGGNRPSSRETWRTTERPIAIENDEDSSEENDDVTAKLGTKNRKMFLRKGDNRLLHTERHNIFDSNNIRTNARQGSLKNTRPGKYHYPPKTEVPLPTCFHNPSGYVCCNLKLNNLIEETYEKLKNSEDFNPCNIGKMARAIQLEAQEEFSHPFESVVALADFAQNVHFAGDMVCKLEIDGKFMFAYATPYNANEILDIGNSRITEGQSNRRRIRALPIHNFRM